MKGLLSAAPKPLWIKRALSAAFVLLIAVAGCGYQWHYNRERARITAEVTRFYRKYFDREPDAAGLAHWVRWAQDRWGLKKVEQLGFIAVKEKETAH